jgi:CRP-like cAMP-binding protein
MYVTLQNNEDCPRNATITTSMQPVTLRRNLAKGAHLFREDDTANRIFEIESGVLRLTRVMADGRRQVIAFGYPGDVVGFPSNGLYHSDCDALTPATLSVHKREALENGDRDAELHERLLQAALAEISGMHDHFLMLGRKSASERVASFLKTVNERVGTSAGQYSQFSLPMDRSDIADFLGLSTETVCRAISQLRKAKVIALESIHTVIVLKPEALGAIADQIK